MRMLRPLLTAALAGASTIPPRPCSSFLHIGYCPSWNLGALEDTDFSPYTHINIAFAIPKDDCSLVLKNEHAVPALVSRIHGNSAKALIAVGGLTGSSAFSGIASDPSRTDIFANNTIEFVKKYHLDGVDIDWEYPSPAEFGHMLDLLGRLRRGFDWEFGAGDKILSVAVPVLPYVEFTPAQAAAMAIIADFINIMQYDINGVWGGSTGANAPLDIEPGKGVQVSIRGSIDAWRALGFPPGQMVAGLAFYGRAQRATRDMNSDNGAGGQYADLDGIPASGDKDDAPCFGGSCPGTTGIWKWKYLRKDLLSEGLDKPVAPWVRHWDGVTQTPWLFNSETMTFITYDDPESIARKAKHARSEGLRGVMVWSMEMEADNELTRGAKSAC